MALSLPLYRIEDLRTISTVRESDAVRAGHEPADADLDALVDDPAASGTTAERELIDDQGNRYRLTRLEGGADPGWSIAGCDPRSATLNVPGDLDGVPIVAIASGAFQNLASVVSITLADSITQIGSNAFVGCERLERIVFPANLERFDTYWLRACPSLRELTLPGRLRRLRQGLLEYCPLRTLAMGREIAEIDLGFFANSQLESITISPDNPNLVTDGAVIYSRDGSTLIAAAVHRRSVTVPEGCTTIARKAFFYDDQLMAIELPTTLETIEGYAFAHTALASFTAPPRLASIGIKAFFRAQSLRQATLNDGLRSLGDEALAQTGIGALEIPASVIELGKRIVASTDVVVSGPQATLVIAEDNPVYGLSDDGALYATSDAMTTLIEMLEMRASVVTVQPNTTMIGYRAFTRHPSIETVRLPEGLRIIGESSFRGCTRLRSINLPDSLERIEAEAFLDTRVEALTIPVALESIGRIALITRGGNRAVRPPSLTSVTVDPSNPRFFMAAGLLCERERSDRAKAIVYVGPDDDVTIPPDVIDIEDYAFAGVTGLTALRLHRNIRHLGASAFVLGGPVPTIAIELSDALAAEAHRPWLSIDVPTTHGGARTLTLATTDGRINAPFLRRLVDNVILTLGDPGERARYVLPRLADPVFLDSTYEAHFQRFIRRSLNQIVCRFARTAFWEGYDALYELGFLNDATITGAIDAVSESGDVEATSYLLEMKRRRLGGRALDFEL